MRARDAEDKGEGLPFLPGTETIEDKMNMENKTDMREALKLKVMAYNCANGSIPLARQYMDFLNQSLNDDDVELRVRCIEMRKGCSVSEMEELLVFLNSYQDVGD